MEAEDNWFARKVNTSLVKYLFLPIQRGNIIVSSLGRWRGDIRNSKQNYLVFAWERDHECSTAPVNLISNPQEKISQTLLLSELPNRHVMSADPSRTIEVA